MCVLLRDAGFPLNSAGPIPRSVLERAFAAFHYPVIVVQAGDERGAVAIIATWAMQVSFQPPLVALAIERDSAMKLSIDTAGSFSLNFLPAGETKRARKFLKSPSSNGSTIAGMPMGFTPQGIPVLSEAAVSLGCRVTTTHPAGDHVLYLGEVVQAEVRLEGETLRLKETGWKYFR